MHGKRKTASLILFKSLSELSSEAEHTYAGFVWWVLDPLFSMAIYYFVFAILMKHGTPNFVPFLLIGVDTWRWINSSVMRDSYAILAGYGLMQQVYQPKMVFPTVCVLTDLIKFAVVMIILLIVLPFAGAPLGPTALLAPLLIGVEAIFILGFTYLTAALVPFFPDLRIILSHGLNLMFFMSGIFFDIRQVPLSFQRILYLNPMAVIIDAFRDVLMRNQLPGWSSLAWVLTGSLVAVLLGLMLIRNWDYEYPKVN